MQAKSIKGKSPEVIPSTLQRSTKQLLKLSIGSIVVSAFTVTSCSSNHIKENQQNGTDQLAGMYKLLFIQLPDSTGVYHEQDWAKGGESYILYDGKGHMMVQIIPKGYQDFKWLKEEDAIDAAKVKARTDSMTEDELKAAVGEFSSCYTYVADYTIDSGNVITHHRLASSVPDVWGTDVKRKFDFKGDTLILQVQGVNRKLYWLRQK